MGVERGMQTREMARTGRIALELYTGGLPASPPVEGILEIMQDISQISIISVQILINEKFL